MTLALHPLDHLVLPTAGLDTARQRLEALGFTVAPMGVHPFGTRNCCVYLADGTFMEPLAIGDAAVADDAARAGNVFVARDLGQFDDARAVAGHVADREVVLRQGDAEGSGGHGMAVMRCVAGHYPGRK